MRIGILGMFYGCADQLPRVMEPWVALKNEGHDLVLGAMNAQFKEYAELGFPDNDDATRAALKENQSLFDFLHISKAPLMDPEARTVALQGLLPHKVDLIWTVDGDEFYTKEQILGILEYVKKTPMFDYYHIPFDNLVLDTVRWDDGFTPPRIFRTDRHGGLRAFVWENELEYNDGTAAADLVPSIIPRNVAYVDHHTWGLKNIENKVRYQHRHFGFCPYRYDPVTKTASFDPAYFARWGLTMPVVKDGKAKTPRESLHVIVRSHSTGDFRTGAPRLSDSAGGRRELSKRSLRSLVRALLVLARANSTEIHLTVVDDHSDSEFLHEIKSALQVCPFEARLINLEDRGNAASLEFSLNYAHKCSTDFIYLAEDDYLHEPSEFLEMMLSYHIFSHNLGRQNIGLFPVDYSDFYLPDGILPTRVVKGSHRHWRVSYSTTGTFFLPHSLLEEQWQWFIKNPASNMQESGSFNVVWQNYATLFSPIPTLAIHLHDEPLLPPFSNWRRLWDTVDTPLYEQR